MIVVGRRIIDYTVACTPEKSDSWNPRVPSCSVVIDAMSHFGNFIVQFLNHRTCLLSCDYFCTLWCWLNSDTINCCYFPLLVQFITYSRKYLDEHSLAHSCFRINLIFHLKETMARKYQIARKGEGSSFSRHSSGSVTYSGNKSDRTPAAVGYLYIKVWFALK